MQTPENYATKVRERREVLEGILGNIVQGLREEQLGDQNYKVQTTYDGRRRVNSHFQNSHGFHWQCGERGLILRPEIFHADYSVGYAKLPEGEEINPAQQGVSLVFLGNRLRSTRFGRTPIGIAYFQYKFKEINRSTN